MIAEWLEYLHFKAATLLATGEKITMQYQKNKWHTTQSEATVPLQKTGTKA
ncbi:MAG: hypothetical protein KL787_10500 [Taibaiella sp.]|nr:hypothetical protein [Taibaiella sp.]